MKLRAHAWTFLLLSALPFPGSGAGGARNETPFDVHHVLRLAREWVHLVKEPQEQFSARLNLISLLAQSGNLEAAIQEAESLPRSEHRDHALVAIGEALADQGRIHDALRYFDKVESVREKDVILASIARAYAQNSDMETALQTIEGLSAGYRSKAEAISGVAMVCQRRACPKAEALFQQAYEVVISGEDNPEAHWSSVSNKGQIIYELAVARGNTGDKDGCRKLLAQFQAFLSTVGDRNEANVALLHVARAYVRLRFLEEAEAILASIPSDAGLEDYPISKPMVMAEVATEYAVSGQLRSARRTVDLIQEPTWLVSPLCEIAVAFWKHGDRGVSEAHFRKAMDALSQEDHGWTGARPLLRIALARGRIGDSKGADRLIQEARRLASTSGTPWIQEELLRDINLQLAVHDHPDEAYRGLSSMSDNDSKCLVLRTAAQRNTQLHGPEAAYRWVQDQESSLLKACVLMGMADFLLESRNPVN